MKIDSAKEISINNLASWLSIPSTSDLVEDAPNCNPGWKKTTFGKMGCVDQQTVSFRVLNLIHLKNYTYNPVSI